MVEWNERNLHFMPSTVYTQYSLCSNLAENAIAIADSSKTIFVATIK